MTQYAVSVLNFARSNNQPTYREAVSEIIHNIQGKRTDDQLAELLQCSRGTVRAAREGISDLSGATLAIIGAVFGVAALNPFLKLTGGRGVPLTPDGCVDSLAQACSGLTATYIDARHPASPLGIELCHVEAARIKKQARLVSELASGVA